MGKLDKECVVEIQYKNIKDAIFIMQRIKALRLNYYKVHKTYFVKGAIKLHMIEKKYPSCPIRSTLFDVCFNEEGSFRMSWRTAISFAYEVKPNVKVS